MRKGSEGGGSKVFIVCHKIIINNVLVTATPANSVDPTMYQFNPFLYIQILDHQIIYIFFIFFLKIQLQVKQNIYFITVEYIMENEAFAPVEQILHFP